MDLAEQKNSLIKWILELEDKEVLEQLEILMNDNVKEDKATEVQITPFVKDLSGVISLPDIFDEKKEYWNSILKKNNFK